MSSPPKSEYHDTASSTPAYNTPPALIAFTLTVLILCFVAFSIVCLCKYCFSSVIHTWAFQRTPSGSLIRVSPDRSPHVWGLDPTLLEGFPTFLYSSVKDLRKEKSYSLECAICLLEFEDDSMLRLLTLCCHVFHQDCIDLWLRSHKTCPVCRTDLDSPPIPKSAGEDNNDNAQEGSRVSDIRIDVREGEGSCVDGDQIGGEHEHEYQRQEEEEEEQQQHRLARSHSTGHSIVLIREGDEERDIDDKYTLRLPEHVIRGGHNCTRSCVTYNEIMTERPAPCSNCGFVQPLSQSSSLAHAPQS